MCIYITQKRFSPFILFSPFISVSCWQGICIAATGTGPDTCQQIIIPIFFLLYYSHIGLSLLSPSPAPFQAHFLPSDPRRLILVSSDYTTIFQSPRVQSSCLIVKSILSFLCFYDRSRLFLLHHCLHTSLPEVSAHCLGSDRLVHDMLECFWDLYCCFSLPIGNKVDCMMDIGWG